MVKLHVPVAVWRYDVGYLVAQRHLGKRRPVRWETSSRKRVATCHFREANHTERKTKKMKLKIIITLKFLFSFRAGLVFFFFFWEDKESQKKEPTPLPHTKENEKEIVRFR
jgi:hypothetical protein